jgi:hypothetical protein
LIYSRQHFFVGRVGVTDKPGKASRPTPRNRDPLSNASNESILNSEKHSLPETLPDAGRLISTKPVRGNVHFSIHDNLDPDSNATEGSDPRSEKHSIPETLTDAGRIISTKPVQRDIFFSIRANLDPDSNAAEGSHIQ